MPAKKVFIFANPIAGRGKGKMLAEELHQSLSATGFPSEIFLNRASDLNLSELPSPATAVISIGGDGTLRSVVNLFYPAQPLQNLAEPNSTGPAVLPVPMGTANLMGQHLGIHWKSHQIVPAVIETIRRNQIVHLDAGLANDKLFLLMTGVGIDAQIVHLLDQMRRGPIDMTSYLLPAAMTFASYRFPMVTVSVDDQTVIRETPAIVMIANVREYGIGFPILPDAVPNDGLLDLCIMPCRDRRELIEILVHIAAGEHTLRENTINLRGKTIQVESDEKIPVQIDGDSAGYTPLQVNVLPRHVPFLIPAR